MSRERKPNRFGARISSIFNSTDAHHHLEKKSSQASLKPLSHPQLSNKSSFSDLVTSRPKTERTHSATSQNHPPGNLQIQNSGNPQIQNPGNPQNPQYSGNAQNSQYPGNAPREIIPSTVPSTVPRTVPTESDYGEEPKSPPMSSPRSRLSRRPPPDQVVPEARSPTKTLHSHKRSEDLGDIIGTLEQEIDQMMGSPNLELTSTASFSRSYLSASSSSEHVNPLSIKKSPKDFDISRSIKESEPLASSENSPLRQLHSSRYPNRDSGDFADSISSQHSLGPRTPKPFANKHSFEPPSGALRSYLAHKSRSPGMPSPSNDFLNYSPDVAAAPNSTPPPPAGDFTGVSPRFYDPSRQQGSIQGRTYDSYSNDMGMGIIRSEKDSELAESHHESSDYGCDQKSYSTNNDPSGVIDEYDYGSSVSVLNKHDPFARNYANEAGSRGLLESDSASSKHNAYNDNFSFSGEKETMSISSSEQFAQRDRAHALRGSRSPNDYQIESASDFASPTPNELRSSFPRANESQESESFFDKDTHNAPESLNAEIESLGQEMQSLCHDNALGQDNRSFVQDTQSLIQDTRSVDQFDAASYAASVNRFNRQGSQKTFSSTHRMSETSANAAMTTPIQKTHQRMSSTSSILSSTSNKHVNLATLKMTFNLRPGEGEHSNYVDTIRRNAGTSYNETGPGNWKLPIGIMPVDKRVMAQLSSSRYNRANIISSGSRAAKSSGVELKHGHLAPRLLAAEVEDGTDASSKFGGMDISSRFGSMGDSSSKTPKSNITPVTSKSSTPSGALVSVSRVNSLERAGTLASVSTTNDVHSSLSKLSGRRESTGSLAESVGSINDSRKVDIYYQHPGYKYNADKDDTENDDLETDDYTHMHGHSDGSDDDEGPRLVLANPDSSSE